MIEKKINEVPIVKKATMKDIAREASVSVATVSYILNKVDNQTITDETRCRVLDTAKRLNYVPSLTARSLVKGKSGMLVLLFNRSKRDGYWKQLYYGMLAERMEAVCNREGYHLLVLGMDAEQPNLAIVQQREVDGVLLVDVKKEVFRDISVHFNLGVPVVLLDSYIEDPLFHKVVFDYRKAFALWKERTGRGSGQYFLVMESFNNDSLMNQIIEAANMDSDSIFILSADSADGLPGFLAKQRGKSGAIINEFVGMHVANASQGMELPLTVFCTSGCPELLPPDISALRMEMDRNQVDVAFQIMQFYIDSHSNNRKHEYTKAEFDHYIHIPLL
ncbi:LacI family transcriptional regulator [Paenibacillus oenotherae]|uniref:LacI family transcriptional regulator n=1 Tax=Paenibacillus oenotherae TaxID=1435645 RepID=A0ABS7D1W6_9BACL|nr:LacI family DNA-binding transcriptional regulator [Paenibacillus oenotherae]MBW7473902.1 LacI family transcriptional regulator [Paenibacillus oenotherae]